MPKIARLRQLTGIDIHVGMVLLLRVWSIVAGTLMLVMVPLWLTPVEQGYYYTFASLLALQIFFELGFNQVITQFVAHEVAHLALGTDGSMSGPPLHLGRLSSLIRLVRRWYVVASLIFLAVVSVGGSVFFQSNGELLPQAWLPAWLLLASSSALNLYLSPYLSILEGFGRVGQTARMRLLQSILGYSAMWSALAAGLGLNAVALAPLLSSIVAIAWLRTAGHSIRWLRTYSASNPSHEIHWRQEIFPFQWRIALSWASGYLIFQLFTPVTFARSGASEAGRLGIALSIFTSISNVGMSWVNARLPVIAAHIARGERAESHRLFNFVLNRSVFITALLCFTALGAVALLQAIGATFERRIAGLDVLVCLALSTVAWSFVSAAATYMRAHKEEPMLTVSVVVAGLTFLAIEFGARHSTFAMMGSYAAITLLVLTPWTAAMLRGFHAR